MNGHPITLATVGLAAGLIWSSSAMAVECSARSGPNRTALLELYTSEGCSSCPPADRWLSGLRDSGVGPATIVPLAFHVDYWNKLGWPDRFSQGAYSARQSGVAQRNRLEFVYTPQFVLDGKDFRAPSGYDSMRRRFAKASPERAAIELRLTGNPGQVSIMASTRLVAGERSRDPQLFVALTEDRLSTQVAAGENQGRQLRHDAVVRTLIGPVPFAADGTATLDQSISLGADWTPGNLAVAAFVQDQSSGDVLQALALPFCR
jgi:hypothetical protein